MISEDFIKACCDKVFREPIAIKLNIPYWMTATKYIPIKYMRMMTLHDPDWLFFVLPKKTSESELREVLTAISPYCMDCYFVV